MVKYNQLKNIPKIGTLKPNNEPTAYLHFYNILGKGDWYVCEAKEIEDDILFYGYVEFLYNEWGYFTLKELEGVPSVFQDREFTPTKIKDIIGE